MNLTADNATQLVSRTLLALADNGGAAPSGHLYARLGLESTYDLETLYQVLEQCFPAGALIARRGHLVSLTEAGVAMVTK